MRSLGVDGAGQLGLGIASVATAKRAQRTFLFCYDIWMWPFSSIVLANEIKPRHPRIKISIRSGSPRRQI
jgi:hypothetical protein